MKVLDFIIIAIFIGSLSIVFHTNSQSKKWTARIVVTDSKGNLVKGKKPSVVYLAESPTENLHCRVESVD